jgi:diaminopimelate epimerase
MGRPSGLQKIDVDASGEALSPIVLSMGNPQCVLVGPLPDPERFRRLGALLERHARFPEGTNVEFAEVESPDCVRILIWERGVGPTTSSGTGSCAALVAAAAYGGANRDATVIAPGGPQRVEWCEESVYLTGWAEVVCEGEWLRQIPRTG